MIFDFNAIIWPQGSSCLCSGGGGSVPVGGVGGSFSMLVDQPAYAHMFAPDGAESSSGECDNAHGYAWSY